ncbi:predicted protein [Nematostella vectensis]|uniref:UMOD/GP2/OIT3-like D8C domain-containing protein n=1 Tax=Nematostella vectensis TaxID=45351 RepID=A7SSS7_NEMVE|nr:predicted protein [Nematostella vectensis]|eukprot:XP_001625330.1 predicted protein [Nematostella vectensis]
MESFIPLLAAVALFSPSCSGIGCPRPADPCLSYTEINNTQRSVSNKLNSGATALCDYMLQSGWYRFTGETGGEIPTSKPEPNSCGTVAPIWMRGALPNSTGMVMNVTACIVNVQEGCSRTIDICVEKCEAGFFVYYLRPPFGCSMAYCVVGKESCQGGDLPNCTVRGNTTQLPTAQMSTTDAGDITEGRSLFGVEYCPVRSEGEAEGRSLFGVEYCPVRTEGEAEGRSLIGVEYCPVRTEGEAEGRSLIGVEYCPVRSEGEYNGTSM